MTPLTFCPQFWDTYVFEIEQILSPHLWDYPDLKLFIFLVSAYEKE